MGKHRCVVWRGLWALALLLGPAPVWGQFVEFQDPAKDTDLIRTDTDNNGPVDPQSHRPPDLLTVRIGLWRPFKAKEDLFKGEWKDTGSKLFVRLDMEFAGLMNPPGPLTASGGGFNPFRFGPHPVFGFVELDADEDVNTGGELSLTGDWFLGAVGRSGSLPSLLPSELRARAAQWGPELDGDCDTPPFADRSGEDFHLAIFGEEYRSHTVVSGDADALFESGETWDMKGKWLHRAHGFEPFSFACGSKVGVYDPTATMRWSHNPNQSTSTISLIFPVDNQAAAEMAGEKEEPNDCDPYNQASIEEALADLQISGQVAQQTGGKCSDIITRWGDKEPENHLDPQVWPIRALLSTSYTAQEDGPYVWSDFYPNSIRGDVTGDGVRNGADQAMIEAFINREDGGLNDGDGQVNGKVVLLGFARNFALFDVTRDGKVEHSDGRNGDLDHDGDIDLEDWKRFKPCLMGPAVPVTPGCEDADLDFDNRVTLHDAALWADGFTG